MTERFASPFAARDEPLKTKPETEVRRMRLFADLIVRWREASHANRGRTKGTAVHVV